ncbi:MAG: hypothetical protein K1W09_08805 [Akkermansia muciniphila]|uniref:hypothetical protein n=1 Tax=Akkermansia muciniphila TaxID=239935 RepID=UPI00261D014A|nr:hypothetical protein [Akkermansia muciniphila]WMB14517.1 hypothetical protein O4G22_07460 [Akkermansia muciniphila]WMB18959.1 hypothetical protein O4G19_07505 [Akkermansia muciniphila]
MHFQRTLNRFPRENIPEYLAVFIGGFGDILAGCLSRVEKGFSGFLPGVAYATAYYHWDGGGCGVFLDRCGKIAVELEELRRRYPRLPVVLIGHSYGGSCAVEVARSQAVQAAPLCLLTIDAVARRQKSVRPACVEWWGNAYLRDGGGFMDAVPRIGGRWGHCSGADANLAFSGFRRDRKGRLYSHRRPAPMLYEPPGEEARSLFQAASSWLEGNLPD